MSSDRFARTFDILELLASTEQGMTVTDVSKRLDLPISSTHNLLRRMVASDVASVTDGAQYLLGARAVRLGLRVSNGLSVRALARRHLQELARLTGDDIYLAVRAGRRVVYVDRLTGTRPVTVEIRLGQRLYLHATAVGKLFAAHEPQLRRQLFREARPRLTDQTLTEHDDLEAEFERIRADGVSISREEGIEGIVGLAVPVYDASGNLAAAIHISALRAQIDRQRERDFIAMARDSAARLESDLGRLPASADEAVANASSGNGRARSSDRVRAGSKRAGKATARSRDGASEG
jgi:DNA-binding IclR family transcriptional regulator